MRYLYKFADITLNIMYYLKFIDMKKMKLFSAVALAALTFFFTSCDEESLKSLSSNDTVAALKEALTIGAEVASNKLGEENGYLNDEEVRIAMPEELQTMLELANTEAGKTFLTAVGADAFIGQTIDTLINRAAEQAAPQAVDIFTNAITSMTVKDGEEILFGADNAATQYLYDNTYSGLQSSFGKVVTATFDQVSVSGQTLNDAWSTFTSYYNKIAEYKETTAGKAAMLALKLGLSNSDNAELYDKINSISKVNTNLGEYVTGEALNGLFAKVADKELEIRTDVNARTSALLQKVFGRLDE